MPSLILHTASHLGLLTKTAVHGRESIATTYITGHVIKLDLRNPCNTDSKISCALGGKVSPSLLQLEFLNYLDLSWNDFRGTPIPSFLGSIRSLTYLDLYYSSFGGLIPPQLGNLSNLLYLCLGGSNTLEQPQLHVENLGNWISHLSSLESLSIYDVDLHKEVNWLEYISMLSLSNLTLMYCELDSMSPSLRYVNFTSLKHLDLSFNNFNHEIPNWLFNLNTSLFELKLGGNYLKGHIPNTILEFRYLNSLHLTFNQLTGKMPKNLGQLKHLEFLSIGYNSLDGPIPSSLGNLSSLGFLYLRGNRLNGSLPRSLWLLTNLKTFMIGNNSLLVGRVSEAHLKKLSKLKDLDMSSTSLTFKVNSNWVPPFQLELLWMSSCQMGPNFPAWLQTQTSLQILEISKSGIMDTAPKWFWKWASHIDVVDLSDNRISGKLSGVLLNNTYIDLSSNRFTGELPRLSSQVVALKMANNSFSGPMSPFLCQKLNGKRNLKILDISTNSISGELSHCLAHWKSLSRLNLGSNSFSGKIPDSWGSLFELEALHLNNNSFSGSIPPSLKNCTSLRIMDLSNNKFLVNIPSWMGKMTTLMILSLRSNRLIGNISSQICKLSSLMVLDLANNSLSGTIPKCFDNFNLMATINTNDDAFEVFEYSYSLKEYYENLKLVVKGKEWEYKSILKWVRTIDLSSNDLRGSIPSEISYLSELQSLNLSFNHLTGSLPKEMGNMKALECLDLSRNHLSGEIPQSMSRLTFLDHLYLSYNNLSGKIPSSTQLQSFDAVSYIGNGGLCGPPLTEICPEDEESQHTLAIDGSEEGQEIPWFYIGMGVGFIVGFWGVCGILIFKTTWRYAYFLFLSDVKDWMYMVIAIRWNQLHNKLRQRFLT